ncbi:MAG TPA: diadenylate cyclase CdaA [Bryobacteraceae bacterium]|nr:diadenylate cyclase CdaA [Bryobacteraceae bacterium]
MPQSTQPLLSSLPNLNLVAILDILVVAFLIYQFLIVVRGRRAAHILVGVLTLAGLFFAVSALGFEVLRTILAGLAPYVPFALIVLFQSEIRRALARLGGYRWLSIGGRLQKREVAEELVLALTQLQQQRVGALIVIERDIGLRSFIESGVPMDAYASRDLLLTIFHPGSPLHDGAVIMQADRIAAAACFLPLTVKPALARHLGTRHRAAIGVTEETDCLSLIVSEETGRISLASGGEIELNVTEQRLEQRLTEHIIRRRGSSLKPPGRASSQHPAGEVARNARAD